MKKYKLLTTSSNEPIKDWLNEQSNAFGQLVIEAMTSVVVNNKIITTVMISYFQEQ